MPYYLQLSSLTALTLKDQYVGFTLLNVVGESQAGRKRQISCDSLGFRQKGVRDKKREGDAGRKTFWIRDIRGEALDRSELTGSLIYIYIYILFNLKTLLIFYSLLSNLINS